MRRFWCVLAAAVAFPATSQAQQLTSYVQVDYVHAQQSVDQLNDVTGAPLNENRFVLRRARLKLAEEWSVFEVTAEAELNTLNGPVIAPRQVEVAVVWPPHPTGAFPRFRFGTSRPAAVAALALSSADAGTAPAGPETPAQGADGAVPLGEPDAGAGPAEAQPTSDTGAMPSQTSAAVPRAPSEAAATPQQGSSSVQQAPSSAPPAPSAEAQVQSAAAAPADQAADPTLSEEQLAASSPRPALPPLTVRLGAGIIRIPFGHDVYELSHAERLFANPSYLSLAFFPGDFDVGVRLTASWRGISATLAAQNGEPFGERGYPGNDTNTHKDFFGRLLVRAAPTGWLRLEVGASGLIGTGFSAGSPATKDVLVWRDLNEDGIAQLTEIQAIRASSAIASQNFGRWGFGGDLRVRARLPIGELTLFAEGAIASNLDRGVRRADPVLLGRDQRSFTVHGGFTQMIFSWAMVGVRVDHFVSQLDQGRLAGGTLVRSYEPFTNVSFAAAFCFGDSLPIGRGRLMADYTLSRDPLGRDAAGRPADLANDVFTVRLQLEI